MRAAILPLTPMLALPVAFWACDSSTPPPAGRADATVNEDATTPLDATLLDAMAQPMDAGILDASMFFPDAAAPDAAADAGMPGCTYPAGAVEPMTHDAVMTPYRWAAAIDGANMNAALDLTQVFCNTDPARDWAGTDVLLFVSAPSW